MAAEQIPELDRRIRGKERREGGREEHAE